MYKILQLVYRDLSVGARKKRTRETAITILQNCCHPSSRALRSQTTCVENSRDKHVVLCRTGLAQTNSCLVPFKIKISATTVLDVTN